MSAFDLHPNNFGHINIIPKAASLGNSWWTWTEREYFTAVCRAKFGEFKPLDDVTAREAESLQRRAEHLKGAA